MKSVDRGDFCKHNPYYDSPQGIGYGVTISAPHMVRNFILIVYVLDHKLNTISWKLQKC